jgi:GntR family transcriptional regulator
MQKNQPIYMGIAAALRKEITSRRLKPHSKLPSEPELVRAYGAARATVRRALAKLQQDGLIYSRQAVGSFVAEPRVEQDLVQLFSFTEVMATHGLKPGAVVLEAGVEQLLSPESPVLDHLKLKTGARVIRIRRLRLGGGEPLVIANTWIPEAPFRGFLEHDIRRHSIYEILTKLGRKPTRAVQSIEAITLGTEDAALLKVPAGSAALLVRRTAYSGSLPVEYAVDYYRGDRTRFWVHLGTGAAGAEAGHKGTLADAAP